MGDVKNLTGFEASVDVVQALAPQAIADATPVLSAAIDTRLYPRKRVLVVAHSKEASDTAHTMTFSVTESATSGGSYTAATTSGDLTPLAATGIQYISVKKNPSKPFIKVVATGSHADVDVIVAAAVLFVRDGI